MKGLPTSIERPGVLPPLFIDMVDLPVKGFLRAPTSDRCETPGPSFSLSCG